MPTIQIIEPTEPSTPHVQPIEILSREKIERLVAAATPGPWDKDNVIEPWYGGGQPGCMVRIWRGNQGLALANCLTQSVGDTEAVANARLAAAAHSLAATALALYDKLSAPTRE